MIDSERGMRMTRRRLPGLTVGNVIAAIAWLLVGFVCLAIAYDIASYYFSTPACAQQGMC